jgi:hypothetical protein
MFNATLYEIMYLGSYKTHQTSYTDNERDYDLPSQSREKRRDDEDCSII